MPVRVPTEQIENLQTVEIGIAGPEGATRQFVITGILPIQALAFSQGQQFVQQIQSFTTLVGPLLTRKQFLQAVATAAFARTSQVKSGPGTFQFALSGVDADWDDESKQTELRVEVTVGVGGTNNNVQATGLTFQVTIVAELPQ